MRLLVLNTMSAILLSTTVLPALAGDSAQTSNQTKNAVVETSNVKGAGLRFFHANKKLALKNTGSESSASVKKGEIPDLNYDFTDSFPTW
jgi:hypothetical protein